MDKMRRGYTPVEISPKADLTSTYKNLFKPLVNRKDFNLLFELFDTNEVVLRAWSFLGLHHILEENIVYQEERIKKIQEIILEVLKDEREIVYYGGSNELRTSLREHHVRRVCELDKKVSFEPALEYCSSFEKVTDSVVADLAEDVISKHAESNVESLILRLATNTSVKDFHLKDQMVKTFENLSKSVQIIKLNEITILFKEYLKQVKENEITEQDFLKNVKSLQENLFRVAAILGLGLEEETLEFINSLKYPYNSLDVIAKRYKSNEKFISIISDKLNESNNPNFISEILKAILVMKDKIENWQQLILKKVKEFQIVDASLIDGMQESNLINQDLILELLKEGDEWSLGFIREFFIDKPESLEKWQNIKEEFIRILEMTSEETEVLDTLIKKKELVFKLIIDLEQHDLVPYCLNNFNIVNDENMKKMAIFPILKFGTESLMLDLKGKMKQDPNLAKFVLNFIESLDRNDWKFFY
jgi:hypothetical protein